MSKLKKVFYIADICLPSTRAYAVHVLKMVDNLSYFSKRTELLVINKNKDLKLNSIKKKFLLWSKKKIFIKSLLNSNVNNALSRLIFGIKSALYLKKENGLILTRSMYASLFLIILKKKHFLEIHNNLFGLTRFIFLNLRFIESKMIIKTIFISKNLYQIFSQYKIIPLILPDGVEMKDYKKKYKVKKNVKNLIYVGSFYKGRGIELILNISKKIKELNFYLYGKRNNSEIKNMHIPKNVKIYNFLDYSKIPSILRTADLLLMPYSTTNVSINSEVDNTVNYMSPLKMFEYLASGVPILSSNIPVLKEILINRYNAIIVKNNNNIEWISEIKKIAKSYNLRNNLSTNQIKTAKINSWYSRSYKIIKSYPKNL